MSSVPREVVYVPLVFGEKGFLWELIAAMSSLSLRFWRGRSLVSV